jgi:alpha-beta hydrolase superfamily lysophospholipase
MRRLVTGLTLVALALAAGASARADGTSHACVRAGEVTFKAADGTKLVAHRFGSGARAVVLVHQGNGSLCEWVPYARRLAAQGYFVLPLDLRGHGLSQRRSGAAANRLAADVAAAVRYVRALGKKKVFVVGASMGGIAGLVAGASVTPPLAGVGALSAPARFRGMDAVATAPRLRAPVLYVAAEADDNAGFDFADDARALDAATASADKQLEMVDGALHGIALLGGPVRALLEGWLRAR